MSTKTKPEAKALTDKKVAPPPPPPNRVDVHERSLAEPFGWVGDWLDHWQPTVERWVPDVLRRPFPAMASIKVEQFRADGDMVVRAELPGVDPEKDIDVTVSGDRLTISAKREEREETRGEEGFRSEFHYGSFERTMPLPAGVDAEDVDATYSDGILEVRVPIDEDTETKAKVPVGGGSES